MKAIKNITTSLFLLIVLQACNSDVFVDDFRPSATEITVDGNDGKASIRFASGEWDVLNVFTVYGSYLSCTAYDMKGNVNPGSTLTGLGKIVCQDDVISFTVERSTSREVTVTDIENISNSDYSFDIMASNDYESHTVSITIPAMGKYVIDRIDYSLSPLFYSANGMEYDYGFKINNNSSNPQTYILKPYWEKWHKVRFILEDGYANALEEGQDVEIPCADSDGSLSMKGDRVRFSTEELRLPLPFDDTEQKEVIIPANTYQRIQLFLTYEEFDTECTLYATHPKTGKQRIFTGKFRSKMPIDYFVTREDLDKKEE